MTVLIQSQFHVWQTALFREYYLRSLNAALHDDYRVILNTRSISTITRMLGVRVLGPKNAFLTHDLASMAERRSYFFNLEAPIRVILM